ncbi:MAG: DUF748 domain-containing protein [Bacteroidales bacterium]|nr:DUF748 domain-containing protein [Bacteroidales bacterium]
MIETESGNDRPQALRRPRRWWKIMISTLFLILFLLVSLFFSFNYFGELLLRRYLQETIRDSSKGLYRANFKSLNVNFLAGRIVIDSFDLIPDTARYRELKAQGSIARSLYQISFSSLMVDKVHFRQVITRKRINFRQLIVQRPILSIVGFPDTLAAKRNKWRVIYEDLYPTVSEFFNDFHIDSVKVNHGFLLTTFRQKTGRQMTGEYEFSSVLKDVSVNPFSYYNRDRVFYSRDVDLIIHNFESQLADSLYLLKADEIGFSLTKSILYGKKVSLLPNFEEQRIRQVGSGDLFRIDLPEFSISGIDLYRAMTGREVEISSVNLTNFVMQVYRNKTQTEAGLKKKIAKKITLAGLYTVVAKELRFIAIDSLHLKNGSFEFFGNVTDTKPELHIGTVNLELNQFLLDSITHQDQSRIFYSQGIELELERISLILRDRIHHIGASAIRFSTRNSLIDIHEASIFPDGKKNLLQLTNRRNTISVNMPRLTFSGIDLKKVFNRRILDFEELIIEEPEVKYTRFRKSNNPDPRFKKPEDFFDSENEDVVYDLLKKYLWVISGNEININRGFIKFSVDHNGSEMPVASSDFDLSMQQFLIDSVHGLNERGYFYSRDFNLALRSVSVVSPDSLNHLRVDHFHINTGDSLIEAENIHVVQSAGPIQINSLPTRRRSLTFEFTLHKLQLTGLSHKKLFLEKVLKANQIVFDKPVLFLKTGANLSPEGPPAENKLLKTDKFVHTFEIGNCLVRKGSFSYDGEEDIQASYFSLKDIDFEVADAMVQLPEKGVQEGVIKFDSLHLKVFPLRAVIADSAYALEARSLEVYSYPSDIILKGIKVTPLKPLDECPDRKSTATLTIPEMQLNGFWFDRAIFNNQWLLEKIYVDHPMLSLEIRQNETKSTGSTHIDPAGLIRFPPFMKTVVVNNISIVSADAGLIIHQSEKTSAYTFADVMIDITRFRVDSATRSNPSGTPLFNADDITLSAPGFSWPSPDSMYTFTIGRFGLSTGSANAFLDSVTIKPNFSKVDFSRKLGYQTDRIVLEIPRIRLTRFDFHKLVSDRQVYVVKTSINDITFEAYRDKRMAFPTWQRPLMPGRMIAGITFPVSVDTIALLNGFASYEEQTGNEPGRIFFDRLNATLTGFSTQDGADKDLDLHGVTRLMGLAPVEAWFHLQKDHPRDSFTVRATIGELDMTAINPMLSKLMPVSVRQGTATSTDILQINGNDSNAVGTMNFRYHNLAIRLHPTKPGTWNRIEQSLLTSVVNLLLPDSNPDDNGKMKHGIIYIDRDPSRGFLNYVWRSVLSGLKSSVGFNSRVQKMMKKEDKLKVGKKIK